MISYKENTTRKWSAIRKTLQGKDQLQGKHYKEMISYKENTTRKWSATTKTLACAVDRRSSVQQRSRCVDLGQRICVFSFTSKNRKKHLCNLKLFSNITAPSAHDTWPHVTAWPRAVKFLWSALSRKSQKSEDKKRNDAPVSPSSFPPLWLVFPGLPLNIYSLIIEMILRRTKKGRGENENIAKGTTDPDVACYNRIKSCTRLFITSHKQTTSLQEKQHQYQSCQHQYHRRHRPSPSINSNLQFQYQEEGGFWDKATLPHLWYLAIFSTNFGTFGL